MVSDRTVLILIVSLLSSEFVVFLLMIFEVSVFNEMEVLLVFELQLNNNKMSVTRDKVFMV